MVHGLVVLLGTSSATASAGSRRVLLSSSDPVWSCFFAACSQRCRRCNFVSFASVLPSAGGVAGWQLTTFREHVYGVHAVSACVYIAQQQQQRSDKVSVCVAGASTGQL